MGGVVDTVKSVVSGPREDKSVAREMRRQEQRAAQDAKAREREQAQADAAERKRREGMARAALADRPTLFDTLGERQRLG